MNNIYTIRNGTIDLNFILKHKNTVGIEAEYKSVDIKFISEVSKAIIRNFYKHYNERTNNTPFPTIVNKKNQMLLDIIYSSMNMYLFHPSIIKDFSYERLFTYQILFHLEEKDQQYNLSTVELRINDEVQCRMECNTDFTLSKSVLEVKAIKFINRVILHEYEATKYHITVIPQIQELISENTEWLCVTENTLKQLKHEFSRKRLKNLNYIINKRIEEQELTNILRKANFDKEEREKIIYYSKIKEYTEYVCWNLPDKYRNGSNLNKELFIKQHYMTEEQFIKYAKFYDISISARTLLNYRKYSIFPNPEIDNGDKNKKYYNPSWIKYLQRIEELKLRLNLGRNSFMENIREKDEAFFKYIPIRQNNIKK